MVVALLVLGAGAARAAAPRGAAARPASAALGPRGLRPQLGPGRGFSSFAAALLLGFLRGSWESHCVRWAAEMQSRLSGDDVYQPPESSCRLDPAQTGGVHMLVEKIYE